MPRPAGTGDPDDGTRQATSPATASTQGPGPASGPAPVPGGTAVLDTKGLRALAHPLRVQLVGLLRKHGPSTATRLAERLGVNSGTASYHLRRLADAGFVAEDTERGNARERWWRSPHEQTRFERGECDGREPEAAPASRRSVAAAYTLRVQRALDEVDTAPHPWRDAFDMGDCTLRITATEALTLRDELRALTARYRRDSPACGADVPEGAERVSVITYVLPELSGPGMEGL
ncbi:ArsR/SmtB family transcription factor [Streptomyces sp. NBC_01497]|uniref:ArsR/SmtB family transcription factor n=1 Tax=Streptomyces sp. NBC_01497 TaxID=2903885 RepID=UPI002E30592E|nr:winged helix-turn-helix domain-containing protein [Streptomyces sp. NBC_01497]